MKANRPTRHISSPSIALCHDHRPITTQQIDLIIAKSTFYVMVQWTGGGTIRSASKSFSPRTKNFVQVGNVVHQHIDNATPQKWLGTMGINYKTCEITPKRRRWQCQERSNCAFVILAHLHSNVASSLESISSREYLPILSRMRGGFGVGLATRVALAAGRLLDGAVGLGFVHSVCIHSSGEREPLIGNGNTLREVSGHREGRRRHVEDGQTQLSAHFVLAVEQLGELLIGPRLEAHRRIRGGMNVGRTRIGTADGREGLGVGVARSVDDSVRVLRERRRGRGLHRL